MARPVPLSRRLEALAAFVLPGRPVIDVGTDHARLPAGLVERGVVPNAIASDRLPGPLDAARRTVSEAGVAAQVSLRQREGLEGLEPGEVGTVVVAGVGGPTIIEILATHPLAGIERFVLQPNGGAPALRRYLHTRGLGVVDETLVEEGGRIYVIVVAEPQANAPELSYEDAELGPVLRKRRGPIFRAWAAAEAARAGRVVEGLRAAGKLDELALDRAQRRLDCLSAVLT